jgi:hypothetical protein
MDNRPLWRRHQHDLRRGARVGQILERVGVIDGGVAVGHHINIGNVMEQAAGA